MKGRISGIKPMEVHDGDGIRTTVFFKGCPLRCLWCHNPESISFAPQTAFYAQKCIACGFCGGARTEDTAANCPVSAQVFYGEELEAEALVSRLTRDKPFYQNGGGVTLSGGECLAQPDFAVETAKLLQKEGIGVYVDTCGFVPQEHLRRILPYTEKFLYDLKAMDPLLHRRLTGQDNGLILQNLQYLSRAGAAIEIRVPLVTGLNDSQCAAMAAFLRNLPGITQVKVLQYHSLAASRYAALCMENTLPDTTTEPDDLERAVRLFLAHGVPAVSGRDEG